MWEQIRSNQTRSAILVAVMAVLFLLIGYFFGLLFLENSIAGLIIALLLWAILSLVAYLEGDAILLALSGARKINREDHPRLYNIVEEMKLASGLEAMPEVYIIDDPSPNAFATGRDPKKASVAVTSGLLQRLNRDELQGVIGHEMAHVQNRDVLLMALCSVLLGSIVIVASYAPRFMLYGGMPKTRRNSSSRGGGSLQLVLLVVAILLMIVAPILAQLIYFALSRRREYLADASSALYTRYPEGLASALEKIATSPIQLKSANNATAPMYIINPFRKKDRAASDLTSTHPPISERIRILRSMAGASFTDYEEAYRQVRGAKKGIIPTSTVAAAKSVSLRAAVSEAEEGAALDEVERARETSDLMWRMGNYKTIDCECGTKLRVPPSYKEPSIVCPHCGRINPV